MDESRMQGRTTGDAADGDAEARGNVVAHREHVVRRLLLLGLSERVLRRLLPEWAGLIDRVTAVEVRA